MLTKLPYMSDSRHLLSRDVHIMIKLLKAEYRPETTSTLGIETSTSRRWFYSSLSKQLISFLLDDELQLLNIELLARNYRIMEDKT